MRRLEQRADAPPWSALLLAGALGLHLVACGGAAREPDPAPARARPPSPAPARTSTADLTQLTAAAEADLDPGQTPIPTECATQDGQFCLPSEYFVERLCKNAHPNVALTLFRKGTPWTRAYVRVIQMEAWYASGGRSRPAQLRFSEELLVLANRNNSNATGIKVSGAGSYDVLRWDGTCVSVMSDEISLRSPSNPDVATIEWRRLDPDIKTVLEKDAKISYRNNHRRESCKLTGPGSDRKCDRAKVGLSRMIGQYLRQGGEIPVRRHLPH